MAHLLPVLSQITNQPFVSRLDYDSLLDVYYNESDFIVASSVEEAEKILYNLCGDLDFDYNWIKFDKNQELGFRMEQDERDRTEIVIKTA